MAVRPYYYVDKEGVKKRNVDFKWIGGLAVSQKRKNVSSLHSQIPVKTLEVSTKSNCDLGVKLSAFNIQYNGYKVENLYQAGKVFENGGPYEDLLYILPKDAKRDSRLKSSGEITEYFDWVHNEVWKADEPFYDYLYLLAVKNTLNKDDFKELYSYDAFTDIEFNPAKSTNTQARAIAIAKLLLEIYGEIPEKFFKSDFIKFYKCNVHA